MAGTTLAGRYALLEVLGRGGMATVYRALDHRDGSEVAVKVFDPTLHGARLGEPIHRARFLRECRLAARLKHPNIVRVLDVGESANVCFLVMELLRGETLAETLKLGGPMRWQRAVSLARQLAEAIGVLHRQGVVHRDLKPANCFVVSEGDVDRVVLLDFGLAKSIARSGEPEVTESVEILGSPAYMSPEQARGEATLPSDLYAFGVVLFRMLAGRTPFSGGTSVEMLMQHVGAPVPWLRDVNPEVEIPRALERIVRRCLEKEPGDRYASVEALIAALDEVRGLAVPSSRRSGAVMLAPPPPVPTSRGSSGAMAVQPPPMPTSRGPSGAMAVQPPPMPTSRGSSGAMAVQPPPVPTSRRPSGAFVAPPAVSSSPSRAPVAVAATALPPVVRRPSGPMPVYAEAAPPVLHPAPLPVRLLGLLRRTSWVKMASSLFATPGAPARVLPSGIHRG